MITNGSKKRVNIPAPPCSNWCFQYDLFMFHPGMLKSIPSQLAPPLPSQLDESFCQKRPLFRPISFSEGPSGGTGAYGGLTMAG